MVRMMVRAAAWVALALTAGLLVHSSPADAIPPPAFAVVDHGPTQGTPVPGGLLTADLGTWSAPPTSYTFEWLRDGVVVPGAVQQDYVVQSSDVGHQLAPRVTGSDGFTQASFTGDALAARKIGASLSLDVRRAHPPGRSKLVWTAITFMTTERPWGTDGGTMTAYKVKDGDLKELGQSSVSRNTAFIRLPWKRAPLGKTRVLVCFDGSEAVEQTCSPFDVVRRAPDRRAD